LNLKTLPIISMLQKTNKKTVDFLTTINTSTLNEANVVLEGGKRNKFARLFPFLGPAFIASVAYVDPGNFATNIQGGDKFGYTLLWVIVASNLMAMLIQTLSAKLGIASGKNLAELCRMNYSPAIVISMWILMELVAIATDLAEFLGAALGFNLLLGIPLWVGGLLTAVLTFVILGLEQYGFRPLEIVISSLVGIIALSYLIETILDQPAWNDVIFHAVIPRFAGKESILLATGILGATVMPHAIFLHSALTQNRIVVKDTKKLKRLFKFEISDVVIAMGIASLVNAAMLIMSAATFHVSGLHNIATINKAYLTLKPLLGHAASWFFGLSLLAAGLSSSTVGTSAGQIIMQGFLNRHIKVWIRRLVTMLPSLLVIGLGLDPTRTLVISQVILSFGLPFAIIPLIQFTASKKIMGVLVNGYLTTALAGSIASLIIALNVFLIYQTIF
jgi:manganese transport protein